MVSHTLKAALRQTANQNRQIVEPPLRFVGSIAPRAERRIRSALWVFPDILECDKSPLGRVLSPPIRMKTLGGKDNLARILYSYGWAFERPMPAVLEAAIRLVPDGLFIDVGANSGTYSLLAKSLRRKMAVHAFEPLPAVARLLRNNLDLNPALDVTVVECAASDANGTATLFLPTTEHGLVECSASLSAGFKSDHSGSLSVDTIRLDDYTADKGRVALMKIDVEGAEARTLGGSLQIMRKDRPVIFCEIIRSSGSWDEVMGILAQIDYAIASISGAAGLVRGGDRDADNHILFPMGSELVDHIAAEAAVPMLL
jgi:FkbM family methyltransferase